MTTTRAVLAGLLLCCSLALTACALKPTPPAARSGGYDVTDDYGRTVHIPHPPQRIVALAFPVDYIVLGLVPTSRMAAVNNYLVDPNQSTVVALARKVKHRVKLPSVEEAFSWQPDLILADIWTAPEKIDAWSDLGIPVVVVDYGVTYAGIQKNIRLVARSLHEVERGERLIAQMDAVMAELEAKVARIPASERKSVMLISAMTGYGGKGSTFDEMCKHAGVINANAKIDRKYGQALTKELLIKSDPDLLFLPTYNNGGKFDTQAFIDSYVKDPSLATMRAIRNGALCYPRESYTYNSSQDFVFGVQEIAYCAYGAAFAQPSNRHLSVSGETP